MGQGMRLLRAYDQSALWARLDELSRSDEVDRSAVDHLKSSVRKIAEHASWISTQVCRFMPQFTLHEERHFLNVLSISEALLPEEVINRLTPLECALPILAAYTHDLGMALSQKEHELLLDPNERQAKPGSASTPSKATFWPATSATPTPKTIKSAASAIGSKRSSKKPATTTSSATATSTSNVH
jgi:hypothetical protein